MLALANAGSSATAPGSGWILISEGVTDATLQPTCTAETAVNNATATLALRMNRSFLRMRLAMESWRSDVSACATFQEFLQLSPPASNTSGRDRKEQTGRRL